MKWQRIQAGHYVTAHPHDGRVVLRHERRWRVYRYGMFKGQFMTLAVAKDYAGLV